MNQINLRPLDPLPRPRVADARVMGDPRIEAALYVTIEHVGFYFTRDGNGDWTGGDAITLGRGTRVSEAWLTAGRTAAVEALRQSLGTKAVETVSCPACGRIMCASELVDAGAIAQVECGPTHLFHFESGRVLALQPDGAASWTVDVDDAEAQAPNERIHGGEEKDEQA